jgi:peroxiredoxin
MRVVVHFLLCLTLLAAPATGFAAAERPASPAVVKTGNPAPDLTLKDLQGKSVSLAGLRGKVVFLNFWATWCPPCREELPAMQRLNEVFGKKDFVILAVNVDEDPGAVKKFLAKQPLSFTVLLDPEASAQNLYGVYRFPETFLIDRQGNVVQRYLGARDWSSVDFLKYVSSLLGG